MEMRHCLVVLFISLFSCGAFANGFKLTEILITNHTDAYGTGRLTWSPCSSFLSNGVLPPHGTMTIPEEVNRYCPNGCVAYLYMTKNCSGPVVATVHLSKTQGVSDIVNKDPKHYMITGGGSSVFVDSVG